MKLLNNNMQWLSEFYEKHGHFPRILHIGNIANNAYNNAKLLNEAGMYSDVICYDYYHIMANPEWEETDVEMSTLDPNRPDWCSVDLGGYQRPMWFAQGPLSEVLDYLIARNESDNVSAQKLWLRLMIECKLTQFKAEPRKIIKFFSVNFNIWNKCRHLLRNVNGLSFFIKAKILIIKWVNFRELFRKIHKGFFHQDSKRLLYEFLMRNFMGYKVKTNIAHFAAYNISTIATLPSRIIRGIIYKILIFNNSKLEVEFISGISQFDESDFDQRVCELINKFSKHFPTRRDKLSSNDFTNYRYFYRKWERLLCNYDVIIGYSTDGIYPLISGKRPYIAFEHGTIRDLPFEETSIGRLASIVYSEADVVYLTNADSLPQAARLNVKKSINGLHGFNSKNFVTLTHNKGSEGLSFKLPLIEGVKVFIAPARHHWKEGFPSWRKGNDRLIRAISYLSSVYPGKFHVIFVEWGAEVHLSKKLIDELHVSDYITWVKPMTKSDLLAAYCNVDCVIDQFILPCIGSVTLDAIALEVPVITSLDDDAMIKFYGEPLELLNCATVDEIAIAMKMVIESDPLVCTLAHKSKVWYERNHTESVLVNKLFSAIQLALN